MAEETQDGGQISTATTPLVTVVPDRPVPGREMASRFTVGRPADFVSVTSWLRAGILRNARGVVAAFIAAWLYVPGALFAAAVLAVTSGIVAYFYSGLRGGRTLPESARSVPFLGDAMENLLDKSSGVQAAVLAVLLGALIGFLLGVIWVFLGPFQESVVDGAMTVVGAIVIGFVVGLLYTLYRVLFEHRILAVTGARRLSRREADLLLPLVRSAADRLGLRNHPEVLTHDSAEAAAYAHTRHIVIHKGMIDSFIHTPDAIAATIAHELVHWRNGDAVSTAFVRGVALPLYVVQAGGGWLRDRTRNGFLRFLIWLALWPVFITVQYFVAPMQASDSRRAEFRADEGAVLAGYRAGMRKVLNRLRSFEGGRNGWNAAICATHPANELRLEAIEEPGKDYPLPDEDAPAFPFPVIVTEPGV